MPRPVARRLNVASLTGKAGTQGFRFHLLILVADVELHHMARISLPVGLQFLFPFRLQ